MDCWVYSIEFSILREFIESEDSSSQARWKQKSWTAVFARFFFFKNKKIQSDIGVNEFLIAINFN